MPEEASWDMTPQSLPQGLDPIHPAIIERIPKPMLKIPHIALAMGNGQIVVLYAENNQRDGQRMHRICTSLFGTSVEQRDASMEEIQEIRTKTYESTPNAFESEPETDEQEQQEQPRAEPVGEENSNRRLLEQPEYNKIPASLREFENAVLVRENEWDLIILYSPNGKHEARRLAQACRAYLDLAAQQVPAEGLIIRSFRQAYYLKSNPEEEQTTNNELADSAGKTDIGRTVKDLIEHAAVVNATDIHIESRSQQDGSETVVIRYRVAGDLVEGPMYLSGSRGAQVANWLFSQGRRNNPQWVRHALLDGVADVTILDPEGGGMRQIQLRLANLPEIRGWDLIIRILNSTQKPLSLSQLGYTDLQQELLAEAFARPYGIIVFSGPTGSGKSTSMMAALETLPSHLKIVSLEQPVERALHNTSHVTTKDEAALARAIPAVNRWDGNITVLGELRDAPSARALKDFTTSGKLTVVTLHASNALAVPSRMAELSVEWSMLSDPNFLVALVNQRLVGKICQACRLPLNENWDAVPSYRLGDFEYLFTKEAPGIYLRGPGCTQPNCRKGVSGRLLCAEIILMDDNDRRFIEERNMQEWRSDLSRRGWNPIAEHALKRVREGEIDPILTENAVGSLSGTLESVIDYAAREAKLLQARN
ncbi:MAG: GspE/PulE family protein [Gammaproteobacteria bacterium]